MADFTEDFTVSQDGSIVLLRPLSEIGKTWADEHLPGDGPMFGDVYAIEHNYFPAIEQGIYDDGLDIRYF